MGKKISVTLDSKDLHEETESEDAAKLRQMAVALPSAHKAKTQAVKHARRVQLAFSNIPEPIKTAFEAEAARRGMGMKEYLFYCLRAGGLDIPEFAEIDGRRR